MTGNSKWIAVESLEEPVTRVARRAIRARLRWLWSRLPLAAEAAEEDVEHVHQLRVASRRAHAALETFAAYLPPQRAAWFDRKIKRIRRAAGEARDLDVLAIRLQKEFEGNPSAAATGILERIAAARRDAQPDIVDVYQRLQSKPFRRRIHKLARRVRMRPQDGERPCGCARCDSDGCGAAAPDNSPGDTSISNPAGGDESAQQVGSCSGECRASGEPSIAEAARRQMRQLVAAWFTAAEADLADTHRLHLFRIAGKRLRYAMEIFAAALGSNCRKSLYPQVVDILEHLGQINDHVASEARLQLWLNETVQPQQRALLAGLLSSDAGAITAGLHAFFALWTPERSASLRRQFADELVG